MLKCMHKIHNLSNHWTPLADFSPPLLTTPPRLVEEERTTTNQQVSYPMSISSRRQSFQTIWDSGLLEDHLLIPFPHHRPSRRQFERTTTSDASIGFPTASFSVNRKFLSLIDLMRSSNELVLLPVLALSFAALLLEQSQPRSAQTWQRTPHFHHFFHPFIKLLPNIIFEPIIINTDNYSPPDRKSLRRSFRPRPSAWFATTESANTEPPNLPSTNII